jgi:hypothetical protein
MINYDEILNKIVKSKDKVNEDNSKFIIKTDTIGNVITGRFLPNLKDINPETGEIPSEISVYFHFIKSKIDNSTIFVNCLNTNGKSCPVCSKSIALWRSNDPNEKEKSKGIRRQHSFITNFYVINDQKKPENNGKVMLLKYGKQIDMKVKAATEGDLAKFYGTRIYRLDQEGCTFMIKPEKNSESKESWVTYTNSTFLPACGIDGITPDKIKEIMENVLAIKPMYNKFKTVDELNDIMNKHYFINDIQHESKTIVENLTNTTVTKTSTTVAPKAETTKASVETIDESELDKMIAELG